MNAVPLSVILPVHDERENVVPVLEALARVLDGIPGAEAIAVDDGSTDGSLEELKAAAARFPFLRIVALRRNYGQTAAIGAGIDAARGDLLLPMDCDGQNDPEDIPRFLEKMAEGYDIVSGWRRNRYDAWLRSWVSRVANVMIRWASGQDIHDYGCTMKLYRASVLKDLELYGDMHRFLAAYAAVHGARVAELEVRHHPRLHGRSKYGFGRIWRVLLDLVLLAFFLHSFTRPMRFFGMIGLISAVGGVVVIAAAIAVREAGGPTLIETPLPVLAALLEIVAVQFLLMGVLAEMLLRVYFRSGGGKPYMIRSVFPPQL